MAQAKSKKLDRKLLSKLVKGIIQPELYENGKILESFILEYYIDFAESDTYME